MGEDEWGSTIAYPCDGEHDAILNHTIAVDPNIIPIGSKIKIGDIEYIAEDVGGAVKGKVIDIWVENESDSFGLKREEIYIFK